METQVRTPQMLFMKAQRLVVPLFQRPYVWNEENQWEPLWNDVLRVTDRVLARPTERHHPHFLGAVVLQQVQKQTGRIHAKEAAILGLTALKSKLRYARPLARGHKIGHNRRRIDCTESKKALNFLVRPLSSDG